MKPQELLLASFVIAAAAGVGASLVTRTFSDHAPRSEGEVRESAAPDLLAKGPLPDAELARALDEMRMENMALGSRMASLEARLAEVLTQRTPVDVAAADDALGASRPTGTSGARAREDGTTELSPDFVESVGQALETIKAREEAERLAKRKELQAERIEERLVRMDKELGLSNRQVSDVRTVLLALDDKREELMGAAFAAGPGPRDGRGAEVDRQAFRDLRDEANKSMQSILTPEQYETYRNSEESDFRRRGPGDLGGPGRASDDPAQGGQRGR